MSIAQSKGFVIHDLVYANGEICHVHKMNDFDAFINTTIQISGQKINALMLNSDRFVTLF